MSLLSAKNLSRNFGGIRAVDNVNLNLVEGEIRALIGPNGAGKSTLVSLLCGRLQASSGSVYFRERDITKLKADKRVKLGIAYTFQITSVFSNLSCHDTVALAVQRQLTMDRKNPHQQKVQQPGNSIDERDSSKKGSYLSLLQEQTELALERVGLAAYAETTAKNLSYGHQRLLEVAMGLALQPTLLMLDEPTQGLSDKEIEHFKQVIKTVAENATVLLIEHNMSVVMALAQSITVLDGGKILAEGTPQDIQQNQAVQRAYLGS